MTDGWSSSRPGQQPAVVPARPRSAFLAHEVFGHGDGAVLVEPEVARDLRSAAEFASQERRIAGGLLYGHRWADDEGQYLVIDGFLEAGPGENRGDRVHRGGRDSFALSEADLRLLRDDAARMYSAALEVGWWRTLPGPGEFGARDFESQRELVGPGGAGLLVFGSGLDWGTAYLGPEGRLPGSARSFIPVPRPAAAPPLLPQPGPAMVPATTAAPEQAPEADPAPGGNAREGTTPDAGTGPGGATPESTGPGDTGPAKGTGPAGYVEPHDEPAASTRPMPAVGTGPATEPMPTAPGTPTAAPAGTPTSTAAGTSVATWRKPALTPPPQPAGPRVISPVGVPAREWGGAKAASTGGIRPRTPTDVKIVVGALIVTAVLAAVIIGVLLSNALVAVIAALVLLLGLSGFLWMSRL